VSHEYGYRPKKMSATAKLLLWTGGIAGVGTLFVLMFPALLYVGLFALGLAYNGIVGEDNVAYNVKERNGVTKAVEMFAPDPSWIQTSSTAEIKTPKLCGDDDGPDPTAAECEMYRGVWETNAPYASGDIDEIAERFGGHGPYGKPYSGKPECVRETQDSPLEQCGAVTFMSVSSGYSYAFKVTVTDRGPGTNTTVTVHYAKAQRGYQTEG
jgi:hypothetical protein